MNGAVIYIFLDLSSLAKNTPKGDSSGFCLCVDGLRTWIPFAHDPVIMRRRVLRRPYSWARNSWLSCSSKIGSVDICTRDDTSWPCCAEMQPSAFSASRCRHPAAGYQSPCKGATEYIRAKRGTVHYLHSKALVPTVERGKAEVGEASCFQLSSVPCAHDHANHVLL